MPGTKETSFRCAEDSYRSAEAAKLAKLQKLAKAAHKKRSQLQKKRSHQATETTRECRSLLQGQLQEHRISEKQL